MWYDKRQQIIQEITSSEEKITCASDGHHDTPGHCSKYCIVTSMWLSNKLIIDFFVLQKGVYLGALELHSTRFVLHRLVMELTRIDAWVTDRHRGVAKVMRLEFPDIEHCFHPWHVTKCLIKMIEKLYYPLLSDWKSSIINHLSWSTNNKLEILIKLLTRKAFLDDLRHLRVFLHSGLIEAYHRLRFCYTPKLHHSSLKRYVMLSKLAVLDHNHNVGRMILGAAEVYSKRAHNWVIKNKNEPKSHQWKDEIILHLLILNSDTERKLLEKYLPNFHKHHRAADLQMWTPSVVIGSRPRIEEEEEIDLSGEKRDPKPETPTSSTVELKKNEQQPELANSEQSNCPHPFQIYRFD
ncbi:hypothetical protein B566_EDAN017533 [Ephemera danica]|nr:hypothetical protein B566_EDAN017533 [Ephemera danica]